MTEREFKGWPKIHRLANETMIISEKIDGSNACLVITEDDFYAQSRTRIITPEDDNFGFARWAAESEATLRADLGTGRFYGEWWGQGIQRKYGLDHRVFSLFDTRWTGREFATANLDVVPLLWTGPVDVYHAESEYRWLRQGGSKAAPGFEPEGIVVYLTATGVSWKLTDAPAPKGPKDQDGNVRG